MLGDVVYIWLGRIVTLYCIYLFLYNLFLILKVHAFPSYPDFSNYGKWSVVTGATDGIGKAMAFELASRGQNIILISRNQQKLEMVSKEIATTHGVETNYLKIDFSHDESIYDVIDNFLQDYDIGVLVNNVGIAHLPRDFLDIPNLATTIRDITRVNITSMVKMHQIVLPGMVRKQKGIILNLSSASSLVPVIKLQLYGATKTFIHYFSQALSHEYEDKGIIIQSMRPFFLKTQMAKVSPRWEAFPSPERWVRNALATVGKERTTHGDLHHKFQGLVLRLIPTKLFYNFIRRRDEESQRKKD